MKTGRADFDLFQDPSGKIPADEPVFFIRGQDIVGPETLRFYAVHASRRGASDELVMSVLKQARAMEEWQKTVPARTPDLPVGVPIKDIPQ